MTMDKKIRIPILARVEGEAALHVNIQSGQITELQLRIFEPPRLFEKLLEGKDTQELIDIVARICGLCPVAYQMTAVQAIENIAGIEPSHWVKKMRRLFYCGEWIQNHSLHIHMLALPDFLGFVSGIEMAKKFPDEVRRGLRLQRLGNRLIEVLGGRSVHPVGVVVGGFTHSPSRSGIDALLTECYQGLKDAQGLLSWLSTLDLPSMTQSFTSVSLGLAQEYPMNDGYIVSDQGLSISKHEYDEYFKEEQVYYSNALKCYLQGKAYLVGPLARMNNNYDLLPQELKNQIIECGFNFPSHDMFQSMIVRAIELIYCFMEAINILEDYEYTDQSYTQVKPQAGIGFGCTEAPRGLLWHRYELNKDGLISSVNIIPPTSQNQARIEEDLHHSLAQVGLGQSDDVLKKMGEMVIRNYDPCISCSTHFLDMRVNRS